MKSVLIKAVSLFQVVLYTSLCRWDRTVDRVLIKEVTLFRRSGVTIAMICVIASIRHINHQFFSLDSLVWVISFRQSSMQQDCTVEQQ